MRLYLFLAAAALLFFTGCAPIHPDNLNPEEKRLVYQSVQDEIDTYTAQGDLYYETGYYADAAAAYEMVNFYEDRAVIPIEKIRKIQARAKANGKHYYKRALGYLKSDPKKALGEFNKMMRNDPGYKDGKARFEALKKDPAVRKFLAALESSLEKALSRNKGSSNDIKRINAALQKLIQYDDADPVALRAKEVIQAQRTALLGEAVRLYNQGSLDRAAEKFRLIQNIYQKDAAAEKYLTRILAKQELAKTLKKAREALAKEDFRLAIEAAEKALDIDSNNKEAQKIIEEAKLNFEKQIPQLIAQGKDYYGKQDLENALKAFQAVLVWDPDDNTSLTYIKKIERQLETIENLK